MDEVYRLTRGRLLAVCQHVSRDQSIAEEVLQDVYITVWRVASRFDPERGSAMTWLMTLARNRSLDRYRGTGRSPHEPASVLDRLAHPQPTVEAELIAAEAELRMQAALGRIEPRAQRLIREAFFGGCTYAELAHREGVPLPTMKSLIRRTLRKLRDDMAGA